jgi:NAD(P)-dependent dehydrogenase (short-subunit alcohol dehydrogenase family)
MGMSRQQKVAVVTGASSGIGEAIARRLAGGGMSVVAVARRAERLAALAQRDQRIVPFPADVTRRTAVAALADHVAAEHGRCDVLVNNAGIPGGQFRGPDDLDDVVRTMQVNFMGTVNCIAMFRDLLVASAPSHVINVASVAGKIGSGRPGYAASKFATVGFSEALNMAWARDGITITQLNPGLTATEGFPQTQALQSPYARLVARPEDVADAVVDVLVRRPRERTVPRWYRGLVVLRHVVPGPFWAIASRTRRGQGAAEHPRDR